MKIVRLQYEDLSGFSIEGVQDFDPADVIQGDEPWFWYGKDSAGEEDALVGYFDVDCPEAVVALIKQITE